MKAWQGRGVEHAEIPSIDLWLDWLFERHQRDLTFQELRRSVQALSATYVERRKLHAAPRALDGKGKRAAFACFFAPLHFLVVREILAALAARAPCEQILRSRLRLAGRRPGLGHEPRDQAHPRRRRHQPLGHRRGRPRICASSACMVARGSAICSRRGCRTVPRESSRPSRSTSSTGPAAVVSGSGSSRPMLWARRSSSSSPSPARSQPRGGPSGKRRSSGRAAEQISGALPRAYPAACSSWNRAAGLDHHELKARSLWLAGTNDSLQSPAAPLVEPGRNVG